MWLDSWPFLFRCCSFFLFCPHFSWYDTSSRPSEQVWLVANGPIIGSCESGHRRVTQSKPSIFPATAPHTLPPPLLGRNEQCLQGQRPLRTLPNRKLVSAQEMGYQMQASRQRLVECSMECFDSKVPSSKATALGRLFAFLHIFGHTLLLTAPGTAAVQGAALFVSCMILSTSSRAFPYLKLFLTISMYIYPARPRFRDPFDGGFLRRHTRVHVSG